jgi:hypothetical protein
METIETLNPVMANLQQAEFWAKQAEFWAKQAQAAVVQTVLVEDDYVEDDCDVDEEDDYEDDDTCDGDCAECDLNCTGEDDEIQDDKFEGYRYLENIIKAAQTQKQDIERLLADIVEREYKLKMELVSANETNSEKIMCALSFIVAESDKLIAEKARIEKILNFLATA